MTVCKVLVVEDDRAIRDMIVATLAERGYAVAAARNGAEALERCRGFIPDLIVLDLHMPEVNGVEFLKQRGTVGCDAPVVLMSAAVHPRPCHRSLGSKPSSKSPSPSIHSSIPWRRTHPTAIADRGVAA